MAQAPALKTNRMSAFTCSFMTIRLERVSVCRQQLDEAMLSNQSERICVTLQQAPDVKASLGGLLLE